MARRRRSLGEVTLRQAEAGRLRVVRRTLQRAVSEAKRGQCSAAKSDVAKAMHTIERAKVPSVRRIGTRAAQSAIVKIVRNCGSR